MSALATTATLPLASGSLMPILGFGTWQAPPGEVGRAVDIAVRKGFRHIDCARIYFNEAEIGASLSNLFRDGVVERKDLFITSKLWNTDQLPEHVEAACRRTLADLQLEYLDLYLIHWPTPFQPPEGGVYTGRGGYFPTNPDGSVISVEPNHAATWAAMEKLVDLGLVRNIGVSNFNESELRALKTTWRIAPAVNQVEASMALPQDALRAVHAELGIVTTAYCPLGVGMGQSSDKGLVGAPDIAALATRAGLDSPATLLLRFCLSYGMVVLTKSTTEARIAQAASLSAEPLPQAVLAEGREIAARIGGRVCNPAFANGKPVFA